MRCDGIDAKTIKLHFTFEYLVTAERFEVRKLVVRGSNPSLQTGHPSPVQPKPFPSRKPHF
jgi:hypothetical protein